VHYIEKRLRECGAEIVSQSLMIDGVVEEHEEACVDWGKGITG
jgi:hypothetical protein